MSVASALATGKAVTPHLATEAVTQALAKAGLAQANGIVLFLSAHFAHHAPAAVVAAARSGGCLAVFGMVAHGLLTEAGWSLDQPAAAALVLGGRLALGAGGEHGPLAQISLTSQSLFPAQWTRGTPRYGLQANGPVWQRGRCEATAVAATIRGARCLTAVSTGLRPLPPEQHADAVRGFDLLHSNGLTAADSLARALPGGLREKKPLPLHLLGLRRRGRADAIPILSCQADGSLTLGERLAPGAHFSWVCRQPLAAERDMAESLAGIAAHCPHPFFALMFSCIGRGPLFYGDDDRDLAAFRYSFPGVPLLGAYGTGQFAFCNGTNRAFHNAVVTSVFANEHV